MRIFLLTQRVKKSSLAFLGTLIHGKHAAGIIKSLPSAIFYSEGHFPMRLKNSSSRRFPLNLRPSTCFALVMP